VSGSGSLSKKGKADSDSDSDPDPEENREIAMIGKTFANHGIMYPCLEPEDIGAALAFADKQADHPVLQTA
jgi:hypothetical protein